MTGSTKRRTVVLLGLAILLTMLVAASLPKLEFQPGMPRPKLEKGQLVAGPIEGAPPISISAPGFILILIALVLTAPTLYAAYQLLRGADWQVIWYVLRYILIIGVVIGCLVFMIMLFPDSNIDTPGEIPIPTMTSQPLVTSPLGSAPPLLLWLVGISLLITTVLVAIRVFTPVRQVQPLELLGLEAERARRALINGVDMKDVIVNCYRQMSLAVQQERGIEREDFMTTGEFETVLRAAGIPYDPIHQLTRLFEAVRYGHWKPDAADEQQAIHCLEAIMVHSLNAREKN